MSFSGCSKRYESGLQSKEKWGINAGSVVIVGSRLTMINTEAQVQMQGTPQTTLHTSLRVKSMVECQVTIHWHCLQSCKEEDKEQIKQK